MDFLIESRENKTVRYVASLKQKKYRDSEKKCLIEGRKFVSEIPGDWRLEFYVFSESYFKNNDITTFKDRARAYILKDSVFKTLSDTETPQGVLAVCAQRQFRQEEVLAEDKINSGSLFLIILEEIGDPGNLGTLIRTADAASASGIILSKGSLDIYNPKVLRAAAGSVFHVPFLCGVDLDEFFPVLKGRKISVYASDLKASRYPYEEDFKSNLALVIGNEARGISDNVSKKADRLIKLPMSGKAESLNASMAGGILMYEVLRQRMMKQ